MVSPLKLARVIQTLVVTAAVISASAAHAACGCATLHRLRASNGARGTHARFGWQYKGSSCCRVWRPTLRNLAAAMPIKRMRAIVKMESGAGDAQEQQAAAAATGGSRQRRRGDVGEDGAGAELEVQQLRANAEAQAFALQGVERERALGEQLLQAKAQVAELRAEIRIRDAALEAKDATHKAKFALIESELQSKEAALQAQIFGRYAAPGKHLVSAPTPPPPISTFPFKLMNTKQRPRATAR